MVKLVTVNEAADLIQDGMTIMVGGFLGVGAPETMIAALEAKGTTNLTIISNDTSFVDRGVGRLIANKQVKKAITSHVGTNAETGKQMRDGTLEVELVPQGTLIERIRAAGAGLGGFLTPTGLGTSVATDKKTITVDGKDYLLELPLRANVALVKAQIADRAGNLIFRLSARNFNPIIATAADIVIVEAKQIVEVGKLGPDSIMLPGLFVDYLLASDMEELN